jgi:hypothetical protein
MKKIKFEVAKIANPEIESFINEIVERQKRGENYRVR